MNVFRCCTSWLGVLFLWGASLGHGQPLDFSASTRTACENALISFTATAAPEVVQWEWTFGNGTRSSLDAPRITFATAGQFDVGLRVTYGDGRREELVKPNFIQILEAPGAAFSASPARVCPGEPVQVQDASQPGDAALLSWEWDYGDGRLDSGAVSNPVHAFAAPGTYPITLIVRDANGCQASLVQEDLITVQPPPDPAFEVDETFSCTTPHAVQFTALGSATSHQWFFGDGRSSGLANPSHTYAQTGSYDVMHIVENALGCRDTLLRPNFISVNQTDIPLQLSDTVVCPGEAIRGSCGSGLFTDIQWDFGNGFTSTRCEPLFSYPQPGTYTVRLQLSDASGCAFEATQTVRVSQRPEVDFVAANTILCRAPFQTRFTALAPEAVSFAWEFGENETATGPSPSVTFPDAGVAATYDVTLVATNADGCSSSLTKTAYIQADEFRAGINLSQREGCAPLEVEFQDATHSPFPITSWQWDFGDGATSTAPNPIHTYTDTGYFEVELIVEAEGGCQDTLRIPRLIRAGIRPIADFVASDTFACAEQRIEFTNLSQQIDSAFWSFGDGDTALSISPQHVYVDTGYMDVLMIAYNNGCADTLIKPDYLYIQPPVAAFLPSASFECNPLEVQFTDISIGADRWLWEFGAEDSSTEQNPAYFFDEPGLQEIRLTVWNDRTGCKYTTGGFVLIDPAEVAYEQDVSSGCAPLRVQFQDTSPEAFRWQWDFGDGTTSNEPRPFHVYTRPGTYEVQLTIATILTISATDTLTCTATQTSSVQVFDPVADFSLSDSSGCVPFELQVLDQSITQAPIVSYNWTFGNQGNASGPDPVFTFEQAGTYDLSLVIRDSAGCSDAVSKFDLVQTSEVLADFAADYRINCPQNPLQFTNLSQGDGLTFAWAFGDGSTSSEEAPAKAYAQPGTYAVSLTATDSICEVTEQKEAYIQVEEPLIEVLADRLSADCPPLRVNFEAVSGSSHPFHQWRWTLGDGGQSVEADPANLYVSPGSYDISLVATAPSGCQDSVFLPDYIQVGGPEGNLTFAPDSICEGESVRFQAQATNVQLYEWDLGGGVVQSGASLTSLEYAYELPGSYFPSLFLQDGEGCRVLLEPEDSLRVFANPTAAFTADSLRFCEQTELTFRDSSQSVDPLASWQWDFGDGGTSSEQTPAHGFNQAGSWDVSLSVTTLNGCSDTLLREAYVEVLPALPPETIEIQYVSVLSDTRLEVAFDAYPNTRQDFMAYFIERSVNGGTFQVVHASNNPGDTRWVDADVNAQANDYCYRLVVENECRLQSMSQRTHCQVRLQAQGVPDAIALDWTPYQGWETVDSYRVYRVANYDLATARLLAALPADQFTFLDSTVNCDEAYTYRIEALSGGQVLQSWSNIASAAALIQGPSEPLELLRVSVEDNRYVQVDAEPLPQDASLSTWIIERDAGNGYAEVWRAPVGPPPTSWQDEAVDVQAQTYRYRLLGVDSCGLQTPLGRIAQSIWLTSERVNGWLRLIWTPYEEWENGVDRYLLEVFDDALQQFVEVAVVDGSTLSFEDRATVLPQPVYCYRITAFEAGGNEQISYSNHHCATPAARFFTPNAFTPNGDGINDEFLIKGVFFYREHLQIFNRWGQKIFESRNFLEGWDGTYQGRDVPEGVYVFRFRAETLDGKPLERTGTVTLIR